ncbi:MAG: DoxX family protein [Alphaproteobacteria bacterium]
MFIISLILTIVFLFMGSIRAFGWQKQLFQIQLDYFIKYKFNRAFMIIVGIVELLGVFLLWLPYPFGFLGLSALIGTSMGATYCHLKYSTWRDSIVSVTLLTLSSILFFLRYRALS